ncbi:MAG: hypothetical protein M0D55_07755 [Elusimicrobiota bacterium]|nr:MAG: hypothetical protein M0D55_07755 [Elusimicrobiota bacterium]
MPRYTASAGVSADHENPFGSGTLFGSVVAHHYSSMQSLRTTIPAQAWADVSFGLRREGFKHTVSIHNATGSSVSVPEYVRQRVAESTPIISGRRIDYTVSWKF